MGMFEFLEKTANSYLDSKEKDLKRALRKKSNAELEMMAQKGNLGSYGMGLLDEEMRRRGIRRN